MKALIVKSSSMGDVIHALPALTDAQHNLADIEFDWLVEESFAEIPRWHPAVRQVIPVALRRWRKAPLATLRSNEWQDFRQQLRQTNYDAIIDAQGLYKSAWLAYLAHGVRHGYDYHSIREPLASFSYHQRYKVAKSQHAVTRIRILFSQVFGYRLPNDAPNYAISVHAGAAEKNAVVFIHATSRAEKLWPETHWVALGKQINQLGFNIKLPWGSEQERMRATRIASQLANADVLPKLSLTALAEVLGSAKAAVAVDTGLAHLAAALALPTVTLYGPTDPSLIGTLGQHQVQLSGTAMEAIQAADVFDQLTQLVC